MPTADLAALLIVAALTGALLREIAEWVRR